MICICIDCRCTFFQNIVARPASAAASNSERRLLAQRSLLGSSISRGENTLGILRRGCEDIAHAAALSMRLSAVASKICSAFSATWREMPSPTSCSMHEASLFMPHNTCQANASSSMASRVPEASQAKQLYAKKINPSRRGKDFTHAQAIGSNCCAWDDVLQTWHRKHWRLGGDGGCTIENVQKPTPKHISKLFVKGSLEVQLPTIWKDEKKSQKRRRAIRAKCELRRESFCCFIDWWVGWIEK